MRNLFLISVLLVLLGGCGTSGQSLQNPVEGLSFPEPKPFNTPEVERFSYNGMEFFLLRDDELPLVNVNVIINGGSWLEPADKVGLASITGTVLRTGGSEQYPEEDLNELLEARAASMETSFGLTNGSARMNVLKEDFEELLPVFTDLLKNPLLPQQRFDLAKTQQRTAISRRNEEASSVASREFRKLIYGPESVYARIVEYATLENITRDDMVAFHQKTMQGSNMLVGVIGDFDPQAIRTQLEEAFGIFDKGESIDLDLPEVDYEFESGLYFAHKGDMNQSQIRMGHIGGYRDNPDYAALQVMNQILSGGFSGRLFQEVRTEQGLAYGVYGTYSSNVRYPGVFFAGLSTAAENTHEAYEATIEQIRRLQEEPVSQEELDETRERIFNRIIFRYDSYARILAQRMGNYNLGLPEDAFETYIDEVRQVTVDDIYRVSNEYLQPGKMKILVVGNHDLVAEQLDNMGDYTEIDISIPRPGAEQAAVEGDPEAGREWLQKMASAMLDIDSEIGTLVLNGNQTVQTPQGEMTLEVSSRIRFPDAMTMEISTPMGSQVIDLADGQGVVSMGGQEQPLPPAFVESMMEEIKKDPLSIALEADNLEAVLMDSDDDIRIINIGEYDLTIHIHQDDHLPVKLSYSQFDPEEGREVEVNVELEDWNWADGVRVAYDQKRYSDGEPASSTRYTSHSVE
ncbi:MAG: M16 family metallopeptidase [Bacteroidota bacterium]